MNDWAWQAWTLAQNGPTGAPGVPTGTPGAPGGTQQVVPDAGPGGAPPAGSNPFTFIFPLMIGLLLFMIISSVMGQRKQRKQKDAMLGGLRRHDQVQTIGGVIGSVVEVRDHEVVVETDRASGTRIRFSKTAIQQVLKPGPGGSGSGEGTDEGTGASEPALTQAGGPR